MVLRSLLLFIIFGGLVACERIPEWENQPGLSSQQRDYDALNALRPWMWTCRGRQIQYRMGDLHNLSGLGIENFLDQFRVGGLSVVDTTGLKTIMGSAFLWDDNGHILSLHHWVEQVTDIECRNHQESWIEAKVVGEDRPLNLALLKLDMDPSVNSVRSRARWQKRDEAPVLNEDIYLVASPYPGSLDRMPIYPEVFRENLYTGVDESLILFHPIPGPLFKGGLVVDRSARILGYLFPKTNEAWGAALKMPALSKLVESMISGGKISRAHLGLRVRFQKSEGFIVQEVEVGGPAYKAGLRIQDRLISWNSQDLNKLTDWPIVTFKDIGKKISLIYSRGEKQVQTQLEIGSAY